MRVCPHCGEENPERFRLCGFCGTPLAPAAPPQEVRKTVTLVFTDLVGSTALGERLDPEAVREVMNRYFDEVRRILERHGGTVEKFIGDAVMAVFGLPTLHEDDALRAVRAAHEIQSSVAGLNDELNRRWGVTLATRIGVNTGEVVAGDAASGQRLVTGDAVNVAARLEQAAGPHDVLISETTHRLVRHAVEADAVEPLVLKGKSHPIPAYRVTATMAGEAITRRLDAPMVGRVDELDILLQAFSRASARRACEMVTVVGAAGVGKSRLVQELIRRVPEGTRVLRGHALPYGDGITFWPLSEVVRQAAGIDVGENREEAWAKLEALAPEAGFDTVAPVAAAIGLTSSTVPLEETFWATRRLLEALARANRLVVVFDDVHWAEPAFLDLIEHLNEATEDAPILLVCTSRRELLEVRSGWGGGRPGQEVVALQALSEAESGRIMENVLGTAELPMGLSDRISKAADGNPLFVEQMLSMLIEDGQLQRDDSGRWTASTEVSELPLPPTIAALLTARLDRLAPDERAVLQRGSVMGQVFYQGAVLELTPVDERSIVGANLAALAAKDLVGPEPSTFSGEEAYRFHHILIRDAAYKGLLKRARADVHAGFADWLERVAGPRTGEYEEIIGYHLEEAYRYVESLGPLDDRGRALGERAANRLASAGRRAFARGDPHAAASLLERAAGLLDPVDPRRLALLPELGEALMETGELARAEDVLTAAIEATEAASDARLHQHALLARSLLRCSTDPDRWTDEAVDQANRAISELERLGDDAGLARAWRLLGYVHGTALRYGAAEQAVERAIHHARRAGDHRLVSRNLPSYAFCALYGPTPVPQAIERCERLLDEAADDRRVEGVVLGVLAHLHAMRGAFDQARSLYLQGRAILQELGGRLLAASTSIRSGPVELLAGDPAAAERELRGDSDVLRGIGETYILSTNAALMAEALYEQDRLGEALEQTRVSEQAASRDDIKSQVIWRCARGKVLASQGDHAGGEALIREALDLIRPTEELDVHAHVLADLGHVLDLAGRPDAAAPFLEEAIRLFDEKGNVVGGAAVRSRLVEAPA